MEPLCNRGYMHLNFMMLVKTEWKLQQVNLSNKQNGYHKLKRASFENTTEKRKKSHINIVHSPQIKYVTKNKKERRHVDIKVTREMAKSHCVDIEILDTCKMNVYPDQRRHRFLQADED